MAGRVPSAEACRTSGIRFSVRPGDDCIARTRHAAAIVRGRSDSTLNRHRGRTGSAEVCEAVEALPAVAEALAIGAGQPCGGNWMPLFVRLTDGLVNRIAAVIRERPSPRHVPDDVVPAQLIPHMITGKEFEAHQRVPPGVDAAARALDAPVPLAPVQPNTAPSGSGGEPHKNRRQR
ncbi:hypothetical protein ACWEHA_00665 [Amycolatopsis nivea]